MNQKGFVSVSLIMWIPIVFTTLFTTFWMLWFVQNNLALQNLCHEHILGAQEQIVRSNNQILSLNSKAYWLFAEKKALDLVILTGPPPAKAAAKIKRRFVVLQQKTLRQIQNSIKQKGNFLAKKNLYELKAEFKRLTLNMKQFWRSQVLFSGEIKVFPKESQLRIKIRDIAPVYKRTLKHERSQVMRAQWSIPIQAILPNWIKQWVPVHRAWKGQCASHPHSGGYLWEASIGTGNH